MPTRLPPGPVPLPTRRRPLDHACTALAVALLAWLSAAPLAAQRERPAAVPDAVLLRRIAEAVDGDRSGGQVYVVASLQGMHPVAGTYPDLKAAEKAAFDLGRSFQVFGPFLSPKDPPPGLTVGCVHNSRNSMMHIRDLCVPPGRPLEFEEITGITLVLELRKGGTETVRLPAGADAIFLTLTAFDKFAAPYYARTLGLAGATEMRRDFVSAYETGTIPGRDGND